MYTCSNAASRLGYGLDSAKATAASISAATSSSMPEIPPSSRTPLGEQPGPEQLDRVALAPLVDLGLIAVVLDRQPEGVVVEPVRLRLHQRGAVTPAGSRNGPGDRLVDRDHILPVHGHAGDAVARGAHRHIGHGHHDAGRAQLAVAVVLAQEHDRQRPDRGQVEALVERALVGRAVAEEAQRHPVVALQLRAERGAGRDRQARADDAGLAEAADAEVGQVHGAAQPGVDAGGLAHELGEQAVRAGALADRVPVRPVVAHHVVVVAQRHARPDDRRLLAHRGVQRAGDLAGFHLLDRGHLERPAPEHPAVHLGRHVLGKIHGNSSAAAHRHAGPWALGHGMRTFDRIPDAIADDRRLQ